ncbi:excalibur calcium-binding domain-containing protein [Frondihabitans peucedani]|jgi:cytochrome c2|uniref:Excalibur calcium-binding domain-containing protein n=1 Tax=Frondihabitans peucedani TaxID=598626 RepID=A0ABP8DY53_9MICO
MISPRLAIAATVLTVAIAVPSVVAADAASAAPKTFANCAAVHKSYSGGIAKAGVKTNTVTSKGKVTHRALKGKVKFDTALYKANAKSDRDKDGIACELD